MQPLKWYLTGDETPEQAYEFDNTHCDNCKIVVAGYLAIDRDTYADVPRFSPFCITPDGTTLCENCGLEWEENGGTLKANGT